MLFSIEKIVKVVTANKTNRLITVNLAKTGCVIDNVITQLLSVTQLLQYISPILLEKFNLRDHMNIFCLVVFFISCLLLISLMRLKSNKVGLVEGRDQFGSHVIFQEELIQYYYIFLKLLHSLLKVS